MKGELDGPDAEAGKPAAKARASRGPLIAVVAALLVGAPLASGTVRTKLAAAWAAFTDPSRLTSSSGKRTDSVSGQDGTGLPEGTTLEGDFELFDAEKAPVDPAVEGVIASLSDLPIPLTQRTMRYVAQFGGETKGRETFEARYRRAGRYREHIVQALHDADFPEDLAWLAAIESGMNPQARSPAGAVGLFQLMPDTAQRFGLAINDAIDERRSVTKSTAAAVTYLRFLNERFGSWDLALAGYNCGEGCVDAAIEKGRAALGRGPEEGVSFRELAEHKLLPKETADFVPQIHAFAIVAHNRDLLGLARDPEDPPLRFAELAVPPKTRLVTVAKAAGTSLATLQEYNPDLLVDHTPDQKGDFLINVPAEALAQTLAALPDLLAKDERVAAEKGDKPRSAARPASKKKRRNAEATPPREVAQPRTLTPAPGRAGLFVLPSGVLVELSGEGGDVELSAHVDVFDPLRGRKATGDAFTIEPRPLGTGGLEPALAKLDKELRGVVFDKAAPALRETLAKRRQKLFDDSPLGPMYGALSQRAFPEGSPLHGALLVGPTEPADDMFLEPEPTWALDVVVRVRGKVDQAALVGPLETAFADTLTPPRRAVAASAGRVDLGGSSRHLLVGWPIAPLNRKNETATHLAFLLACHNRTGRVHRALRLDRPVAARVNCGLELAPEQGVAWIIASPAAPHSLDETEKLLDSTLAELVREGPSETELGSARSLLRTELAKELATATLRQLSKTRVAAENERLLERVDEVDRDDVREALKELFGASRKIVVVGG